MTVLTPEALLDTVFKTIRAQVKEQGQVHPEDVMTTVAFTAETVYQFISNLPRYTFSYPPAVGEDAGPDESAG